MSEEALQPAIKSVQDVLSKYVKRPPLSEKFLKKPPFRYLHDIINTVIRETGFLDGVYTAEELDSNNVKDKESKIAFLNKLINAVKTASGKTITARPAKIVAGLEVEKTLELLQIIGLTIDSKKSNSASVSTPQATTVESINSRGTSKAVSNGGVSEDKLKKNDQKTEKQEKPDKKDKTSIESSSRKRDTAAEGRRTSVSRRESVKKELGSTSNVTGDVPLSKKEGKPSSNKPPGDAKENKISTRRSSIPSKSIPTRKSSLKDSNRSVINGSKKLQSVVIKEDHEEVPSAAPKTTSDGKQESSNKSKKSKGVEVDGNRSNASSQNKSSTATTESVESKKNESDRTKPSAEQSSIERTASNVAKAVGTEKQDETKHEPRKPKESATIQRPGSARPGSRKLHRTDIANNNAAENGVPRENSNKDNSEEVKGQVPIRPRTANRPPSARPGAPKLRDRGEVVVQEETSPATAPVNVIEEGTQDQYADDKDNIILIESEQASAPVEEHNQIKDDADQGQLVHQILKTQKELNDSVSADITQNKHLEIEWEGGKQRERDIVSKEVERIRSVIQVLTSAANPLGKLFDFLQEDVDEMQRELQHWKNENDKFQKQQQAESELQKQSLEPLRKQLLDIEASIEEEYRQIASIKTSILANDDKILKLVGGPAPQQPKTRLK